VHAVLPVVPCAMRAPQSGDSSRAIDDGIDAYTGIAHAVGQYHKHPAVYETERVCAPRSAGVDLTDEVTGLQLAN
jgi:hypothetical protein